MYTCGKWALGSCRTPRYNPTLHRRVHAQPQIPGLLISCHFVLTSVLIDTCCWPSLSWIHKLLPDSNWPRPVRRTWKGLCILCVSDQVAQAQRPEIRTWTCCTTGGWPNCPSHLDLATVTGCHAQKQSCIINTGDKGRGGCEWLGNLIVSKSGPGNTARTLSSYGPCQRRRRRFILFWD